MMFVRTHELLADSGWKPPEHPRLRLRIPMLGSPSARLPIVALANIFLSLVAFLLLTATFAPLAATPVHTAIAATSADRAASITLIVRPTLFRLEAQGGSLSPARLRSLAMSVPRTLEDHEGAMRSYAQLAQALTSIKQRHAGVNTVRVMPDESIPYEEVLTALDVVRDLKMDPHDGPHGSAMFANLVLGVLPHQGARR